MHLLMVAPEDCPVPGGGSVAISMLAIAGEMAKQHKVTIVCPAGKTRRASGHNGNLRIVRVQSGSPYHYANAVFQLISGQEYSCIQIDNRPLLAGAVKARFPCTPLAVFLHSLTFVPATEAVAACLAQADVILTNSLSLRDKVSQRFPSVASAMEAVRLGVDSVRFCPASAEDKVRLRHLYIDQHEALADVYIVLFAGRVIPRKGIPVLIQAVQLAREALPAMELVIAGKGRPGYVAELRALAARLQVPVRFTGNLPHQKLHTIFQLADCFVCPSQKHEAFGLVNVEALATGLPVIASNLGGIGEVVRSGHNGYLVDDYAAPESFARCLLDVALQREKSGKLAQQGREDAVRLFGWSRTAERLSRIYMDLYRD